MPSRIEELLGKYLLSIGVLATHRPDQAHPMDARWQERNAAYNKMYAAWEALEGAIYEIDPQPFREDSPYRALVAADGWLWQARRAANQLSLSAA